GGIGSGSSCAKGETAEPGERTSARGVVGGRVGARGEVLLHRGQEEGRGLVGTKMDEGLLVAGLQQLGLDEVIVNPVLGLLLGHLDLGDGEVRAAVRPHAGGHHGPRAFLALTGDGHGLLLWVWTTGRSAWGRSGPATTPSPQASTRGQSGSGRGGTVDLDLRPPSLCGPPHR